MRTPEPSSSAARAARAALEHADFQLHLAQCQLDKAREGLRALGPF